MRPPFASVEFALLGTTPDPVQIRVIRRSFSHEMVILRFKERDLSSKIYQSDMPVRVTWGLWPKFREEFVGYVHHVVPDVERKRDFYPTIEATCVGATRVLRDEYPRNWGTTISSRVATQAAEQVGLGADVDLTEEIYESLMQPSQSTWAFLISLADREGYHLSATKTRIHFWNYARRIAQMMNHAMVFDHEQNEVGRFRAVSGETTPTDDEARWQEEYALSLAGSGGNFSGRTSAYADRFASPGSSRRASLFPEPKYARVLSDDPAGSAEDARLSIQASARRSERVYRATAEIAPYPPVRPGDAIVFENYGERQSGVWVVDAADFLLDKGDMTTTVEISRAIARDDGFRPAFPGSRPPQRRPVSSALVKGVWVDRTRA